MKAAKISLRTIVKRHIWAKMSRKSHFFFFFFFYAHTYVYIYAHTHGLLFVFLKKKKKKKKVPSRLAVLFRHFRQSCHLAELGKGANDVCCLWQALQPHTLLWSRFLVLVFLELNQHVTLIRRDEQIIGYPFAAVLFQFAAYPTVRACMCATPALKFQLFSFHFFLIYLNVYSNNLEYLLRVQELRVLKYRIRIIRKRRTS